ncbi:MAG: class I tRNA ligase family protein [Deinococcales bacterium]
MLHPMIPFITAELYEALEPEDKQDIGHSNYPKADESLIDEEAEKAFKHLQDAIGAIRLMRNEANIPPSHNIPIILSGEAASILAKHGNVLASLAKVTIVESIKGASLKQVVPDLEIKAQLEGLIDIAAYRARQEKRLKDLEKQRQASQNKLNNERFVQNALPEIVAQERHRLEEHSAMIAALELSLAQL